MTQAGTPRLLRGINDRAALALLLEHGSLSRTQLGALTGLSKPTASQLLTRLEGAGLVSPSGSSAGRPGPRAQLYEINPRIAYVGALDVTPDRILSTVADITGRVVGEHELATSRHAVRGADPSDALDHEATQHSATARVLAAVDGAAVAAGLTRDRLHRVVIGTPGAFDPGTGRLRYARHLPGWHGRGLLDELAAALGSPLEVANDVNLAAVAERELGRARGVDDFVLLWADEGIGAAIVIDGELHVGATGGAGEVGFLPLPGTPLVRHVGRTNAGGFQELGGGKAVLRLARSLGLRASTPQVAVARALTTPGSGDRLLLQLASRFALGLAAVVSVLDPQLIVLAGGVLSAGGDRLLNLIRTELAALAVPRPRLELSGVPERPVLFGAMQMALAATRDEVFDTIQTSSPSSSTTP
jgi:predicted NBD/HSP70 family sugar kinase